MWLLSHRCWGTASYKFLVRYIQAASENLEKAVTADIVAETNAAIKESKKSHKEAESSVSAPPSAPPSAHEPADAVEHVEPPKKKAKTGASTASSSLDICGGGDYEWCVV